MIDPGTLLEAGITSLGVPVDPRFARRVRLYLEELGRWGEVSRLTGYRTEADRVLHLVLDSLLVLAVLPVPAAPLLDVGSGAGAPGLVVKLARPGWPITLIEARRRRANFLRHVVRMLELEGTEVLEARAETLAADPALRGTFRTVTMRAVAAPARAEALARPFLERGGHLVMSLGPRTAEGVAAAHAVQIVREVAGLRLSRRFLIMPADERVADVPRGTRGVRGPRPERGEPEGRGRQDDHRREPRCGARRR